MKYFGFLNKLFSFLHDSEDQPFVYVAMGDSTVEGIGASSPDKNFASLVYSAIKQKKENAQYTNLGVAGAKINDCLNSQLEKTLELKPNLVVLSIGANDATSRTRAKTFSKKLNYLLSELSKTGALVVINNLPDISLAPKVPKFAQAYCSFRVKRFNHIIEQKAAENKVIFIDLFSKSGFFRDYKEVISPDGYHPSDLGYALWATHIIWV